VADDVRDNRDRHRFELEEDGATAFAAYRLEGPDIIFYHTMVPEALSGRGIGSRLVRGALDAVRKKGLKVVPLCPFVRAYIEKHPEVQDLLA
jgi:predicted GNAT family acetyltransferase